MAVRETVRCEDGSFRLLYGWGGGSTLVTAEPQGALCPPTLRHQHPHEPGRPAALGAHDGPEVPTGTPCWEGRHVEKPNVTVVKRRK